MPLWFFAKGLLIGFLMAFPIGPMGVLCIRRSLVHGRTMGFVTGLGIATGDALYGAVAAFGLTAVSSLLMSQERLITIIGGLFLLYLGIKFMLSVPAENPHSNDGTLPLLSTYVSTVALTLTNVATILSFVAIFAVFGLGNGTNGWTAAGLMTVGVFIGSMSWWIVLSEGVHHLRSRLSIRSLRWGNVLSGVIIAGFGVAACVTVLF